MTRSRVGAVTIGQTPRPDLLGPLLARAGTSVEVIEVGALDGLSADRLPAPHAGRPEDARAYPLTTRLRNGSTVTLDEADLAPLVQAAIDRAEDAGAEVTLLLCAGGFLDATARGPLVRPFEAVVAALQALGARRLAVVVPFPGQVEPAARKWAAAGFTPTAVVGDPRSLEVPEPVEAIVLDYVGHAPAAVAALRSRTAVPVFDLGEVGAEAAVATLERTRVTAATASR